MRWVPYIQRVAASGAGATVTFSLPPVQPGTVLRIKWLAAHNTTGANLSLKVGVTNILGLIQTIINQAALATGSAYGIITDQWVMEGETVSFLLGSSGTSGPVYCTVSGELYMADPDEGGPPLAPAPAGGSA
jgi:hypothetical protein